MIFNGGDVEIVHVRYRNAEGFTIATALPRQSGGRVTLVGLMPALYEGDEVHIDGAWTTHPQHGKQFKVTAVRRDVKMPDTEKGVRQWLTSRLRWVGPATANRMLTTFGLELWNVIERESHKLTEIRGLTEERVEELVATYRAYKDELSLRSWLYEIGLTERQADAAVKRWPSSTRAVIEADPYCLTHLPGMKFVDADEIAKALGVADDDPARCLAAVREVVMDRCREKGHTYLDLQVAVTLAGQLTKCGHEPIITALRNPTSVALADLMVDGSIVAPSDLYEAECFIAKRVQKCS